MLPEHQSSGFSTTCWTEVREAGGDPQQGREALEELCRRYWYPLYAFLRRSGHSAEQCQDFVQGFFADLLARGSLLAADPERGRFRTFLLSACQNFVRNQFRDQQTVRRGGATSTFSLSVHEGEDRYRNEPVDQWTAERLFERRWAMQIIDAGLARLRADQITRGRGERFDALRPLIVAAPGAPTQAEVAEQLGVSVGSVKVSVHRLRQQFGSRLREEIAATIDAKNAEEQQKRVDEELRELMLALQS